MSKFTIITKLPKPKTVHDAVAVYVQGDVWDGSRRIANLEGELCVHVAGKYPDVVEIETPPCGMSDLPRAVHTTHYGEVHEYTVYEIIEIETNDTLAIERARERWLPWAVAGYPLRVFVPRDRGHEARSILAALDIDASLCAYEAERPDGVRVFCPSGLAIGEARLACSRH